MDSPLVSIVLPTYNGSRFIRTSINSCLNQSYKNIELIIVNDCSTDDTASIIEEYSRSDARVRIIHNTANQKLPLSLNIGFDAAKGNYFTWTSDDNYYAANAIETLVKSLEENHDTDLVYADYTEIDDNGKIIGKKRLGDINKSLLKWEGCGACFLYKPAVHLRNKGYNPSTFLVEDYDFFLRASLFCKFLYLPLQDLYYYRLHDASLTGTHHSATFDLQKILIEKYMPQLEKNLTRVDVMLLYRKFAVYYAVYKNRNEKVNLYLGKLFSISRWQTCLTVGFIAYKKALTGVTVSANAVFTLVKLLFGARNSS